MAERLAPRLRRRAKDERQGDNPERLALAATAFPNVIGSAVAPNVLRCPATAFPNVTGSAVTPNVLRCAAVAAPNTSGREVLP